MYITRTNSFVLNNNFKNKNYFTKDKVKEHCTFRFNFKRITRTVQNKNSERRRVIQNILKELKKKLLETFTYHAPPA